MIDYLHQPRTPRPLAYTKGIQYFAAIQHSIGWPWRPSRPLKTGHRINSFSLLVSPPVLVFVFVVRAAAHIHPHNHALLFHATFQRCLPFVEGSCSCLPAAPCGKTFKRRRFHFLCRHALGPACLKTSNMFVSRSDWHRNYVSNA